MNNAADQHVWSAITSDAVVQLPAIERFDPVGSFYPAVRNNDGIAIAHVEPEAAAYIRRNAAIVLNLLPCCVHLKRVRGHVTGSELARVLQLAKHPIHLAHAYELMKMQPLGEDGPLLANRWATSFVIGESPEMRRVLRLRYFDAAKARASRDMVTMTYPRNGWVIGMTLVSSPKWALQGEQLGFYGK
ncbi:hypothetical protein HY414_00405 [Candidatus Kaiserbacteria bacterium]|nr:hypothetical protein [Candidatus Kaiserbacteria bacterium]